MYTALVIRAMWVLFCLLILATASFSQAAPDATASPSPQPQIVYTGSLFGYFRVPNLQSGQSHIAYACPTPTPTPLTSSKESSPSPKKDTKDTESKAAHMFLEKQRADFANAILVGTGDNFAPRLEARVFDPEAKPLLEPWELMPGNYQPGNKELYFWYELPEETTGAKSRWVFYDSVGKFPDLEKRLREGNGTIPTDNVGCFLAAAGYAAVVPGKHDFYFGPERVRELARFMASITASKEYKPVQMLGANLVIKTVPVDKQAPPPDQKEEDRWFTTKKPKDYDDQVLNLTAGKSVYPWFSYVQVGIMNFEPNGMFFQKLKDWMAKRGGSATKDELDGFVNIPQDSISDVDRSKLKNYLKTFSQTSFLVCSSKGDPDDLVERSKCQPLKGTEVHIADSRLVYYLPLDPIFSGKDGHFSTLMPAQNYALCSSANPKPYCRRFSVHTPFFYYPRQVPLPVKGKDYADPDPFVLVEKNDGSGPYDVAIFGVVDPSIDAQVGILNFSWLNEDKKLKTVVSAEDPAEALKEQLDYFQRWYKSKDGRPLLKILLAQMSPSLARVLVARLPQFQVVVTAADQEQATSEAVLSSEWSPKGRAGAFIAVPTPYFYLGQGADLEGTLHFGMLEASRNGESWKMGLTKEKIVAPEPVRTEPSTTEPSSALSCAPSNTANTFKSRVDSRLCSCLSSVGPAARKAGTLFDRIKWLTLCAMRERTGADVALIQERDFYPEFRVIGQQNPNTPSQAQQILDRIIWKGDLLTLLYVPGSALKKTLEQSNKYDDDDKNLLSLADEKSHGLEYLGIKKVSNEYLVNEVPVDDKKIYVVVTTDYIAAGDTGYPDLATALSPKTRSTQFPDRLDTVSGIVCRKLFLSEQEADENCLPNFKRDTYLDPSSDRPLPYYERPSFGSKLWKLFPIKIPSRASVPETTAEALEQKTQQHPIWILFLKNFSLGFNGLSNNLSDADIAKKFGGASTPGVTAKKTQTLTIGLDLRLSRSSHKNEPFIATTIDYKKVSIGDLAPQVSQKTNRLTGEVGYVQNIGGGRSQKRIGINSSLYLETQLQRPFTDFTLGTGDLLKITQSRSVLFLPRIGLRWQNRSNSFEGGLQAGREVNALAGYRFTTNGVTVECLPNVSETFADCIKRLSKPPVTSITKDSASSAILLSRPRAGFYWKSSLSIALSKNKKVTYELTQTADFFFNFSKDNATDTRYRDEAKNSLKFLIWPSFSIGPSFRWLLYENKVNKKFLFQREFGFETTFSFNLVNRREKVVQMKNKP